MQKKITLLIFIFMVSVLNGVSYVDGEQKEEKHVSQECKIEPSPSKDYSYQEETCKWVQEYDYEIININKFVDDKKSVMEEQLDEIFGKHWEYKYQIRTTEGQSSQLPNVLCDLISVNGTESKYKVFENGTEYYVTLPVSLKIEHPAITLHDSRPDNCLKFGKLASPDWEKYKIGYDFVYRIATEGHEESENPDRIYKIFYKMYGGNVMSFENIEGNGFSAHVHIQDSDHEVFEGYVRDSNSQKLSAYQS